MLKTMLLTGAMMIAAPVMAQEASNVPQTVPQTEQKANPAQTTGAETAVTQAPADMAPPADAQASAPAAPQASEPAAVPAQTAAQPEGQPATSGAQVASVVQTEFPTYDKNSDGNLNDAEFTEWMGKLRKASEPTLDTQSAEVQTWMKGAFAQADADKSKAVSQGELTSFLTGAVAAAQGS